MLKQFNHTFPNFSTGSFLRLRKLFRMGLQGRNPPAAMNLSRLIAWF
jgi:hypothetical protein